MGGVASQGDGEKHGWEASVSRKAQYRLHHASILLLPRVLLPLTYFPKVQSACVFPGILRDQGDTLWSNFVRRFGHLRIILELLYLSLAK